MNKEEKEAIERIKEKINNVLPEYEEVEIEGKPPYKLNILQLETRWTKETAGTVQTVLNLIQKQDKIIDKMAEQLTTPIHSKEWIKEFYKKECEKDVED